MKFVSLLILSSILSFNSFAYTHGFIVQTKKDALTITPANASEVGDVFSQGDDVIKACYFGDLNLLVELINRGVYDSAWGDWGLAEASAVNDELIFTYGEIGSTTKHLLKNCF